MPLDDLLKKFILLEGDYLLYSTYYVNLLNQN